MRNSTQNKTTLFGALAATAILFVAMIGTTQAVPLDTGTAKKANAATPEGPAYIASDHVGLAMPDTPVATFTLSAGNQNAVADRTEHVYGKTDNTPVAGFNATPQTTAGIKMTNQPGSTATTFTAKAPGDHARALDTGTAENGILGATPADGNHQLE